MQRRMCKVCARNNRDYYVSRKLTGEIVSKKIARPLEVQRTLQCTECGYCWSYTRKR